MAGEHEWSLYLAAGDDHRLGDALSQVGRILDQLAAQIYELVDKRYATDREVSDIQYDVSNLRSSVSIEGVDKRIKSLTTDMRRLQETLHAQATADLSRRLEHWQDQLRGALTATVTQAFEQALGWPSDGEAVDEPLLLGLKSELQGKLLSAFTKIAETSMRGAFLSWASRNTKLVLQAHDFALETELEELLVSKSLGYLLRGDGGRSVIAAHSAQLTELVEEQASHCEQFDRLEAAIAGLREELADSRAESQQLLDVVTGQAKTIAKLRQQARVWSDNSKRPPAFSRKVHVRKQKTDKQGESSEEG